MNLSIECIFCYNEVDPRVDYLHIPSADQQAGEDLFHMFHEGCWKRFEFNEYYKKEFPCCSISVIEVGPPINLSRAIETVNLLAIRLFSLLDPNCEDLKKIINGVGANLTGDISDEELEIVLNDLQLCNRIESIQTYVPRIFSIEFLCLVARRGHTKLFKTITALREELSREELVQLFNTSIDMNRHRAEDQGESTGIIKYLLTCEKLSLSLIESTLPALLNPFQSRHCLATLRAIVASPRFRQISTDSILHIWNQYNRAADTIPHFRTAHGSQLGVHLVNSLQLTGYLDKEHWEEIPDSYIGRAFRKLFVKLDLSAVTLLIRSDRFCDVSSDELSGALIELFKTHAKSFLPVGFGMSQPNEYRVRLIKALKDSGRWEKIPYAIRTHLYFLCKEYKYLDVAKALGSDAEYGSNENYQEPICFLGERLIRWAQEGAEPIPFVTQKLALQLRQSPEVANKGEGVVFPPILPPPPCSQPRELSRELKSQLLSHERYTWEMIQNGEFFDQLCQIECYAVQAFISAAQHRFPERLEALIRSPLFQVIPDVCLGWLLDLILSQDKSPRVPFVKALIYSGRCHDIPRHSLINAQKVSFEKGWLEVAMLVHTAMIEMVTEGEIAMQSIPCIVS